MFDCVVAADLDWAIGSNSGLPWPKLRGDLQHFKRVTCAVDPAKRAAIVMGRKTWESTEVAQRPLPKRLNIVITRQPTYRVVEGVMVAPSLDRALELAQVPDLEMTYVVGGAEIYRQAFADARCRYVYLTRVEIHSNGDTHIPDLDPAWRRDSWDGEQQLEDNGVKYRIERLVRR
ncbi:MAG: dihydrofolate reductase [Kofleriaceae bacterium]